MSDWTRSTNPAAASSLGAYGGRPSCPIHGDACPGDDGGFFIDGNHPDDMFSVQPSVANSQNPRYNPTMPKITFTMTPHTDQPKHSTRFNFEAFDAGTSDSPEKFKPSFYIPKPFASRAKRIRVTIEEIG